MTPLPRACALCVAGLLVFLAAPARAQTNPLVVTGSANGAVTSTPAGIDCGASCSASFPAGATVTLTATATPPATFGGWSGACTGTDTTCIVTMTDVQWVTPMFRSDGYYAVELLTTGSGIGTIASSTGPVYCWPTCAVAGPAGAVVTLTATASEGSVFTGWSGACAGAAATCQVLLTESQTAIATFDAPPGYVRLDVRAPSSGGVVIVSEPAGIRCAGTCSALFPIGAAVTLTATPPPLGGFLGWGGACTGRDAACVISMTQEQVVTADFIGDAIQTFSVSKSGTGAGRIVSMPRGIDCGKTCAAVYSSGTVVTLAVSVSAGSVFAGWSGVCRGTAPSCVAQVGNYAVATARFVPADGQSLTVTTAGAGGVLSSPGGINCGPMCTATEVFGSGTVVTLTASPSPGASFEGWGGACAGATLTCAVTMTQALIVTARFSEPRLTLATAGAGGGTVTLDPPGTPCGSGCYEYPVGTTVTLTAVPRSDSRFTGWGGLCAGFGATCQLWVTSDQTVIATWALLPVHPLTVTRSGTGTGFVTSSPQGISCGSTCMAGFPEGTRVTLTATPATGSAFQGWTGACAGAGACVVAMSAARDVTAVFLSGLPRLTIVKTGTGSGTVTSTPGGITCGPVCVATFPYGAIVNLAAVPAPGSSFVGWTGCRDDGSCDGGADMTRSRTVTAVFEAVSAPPCPDAITFSWNTGNLGATGPVCYRTRQPVRGWGCSSFAGRTVRVNGGAATATCAGGPLGTWTDGYTYFSVSASAGAYPWASVYVW